jgi:hypothetical protein
VIDSLSAFFYLEPPAKAGFCLIEHNSYDWFVDAEDSLHSRQTGYDEVDRHDITIFPFTTRTSTESL